MKTKLILAAMILGSATMYAAGLKTGQISNVTKVTADRSMRYESPVWSPDGAMIAFTGEGYDGLYVMQANGKNVKKVSADTGVGYGFRWSADSREVLVRDTRWLTEADGSSKRVHAAWAIEVSNGTKVRMSQDLELMSPAAWSYTPSGKKSVICEAKAVANRLPAVPMQAMTMAKQVQTLDPMPEVSFVEDYENLYVLTADGNKRLLNRGASFNAQLSPNGKKVVFNEMDNIVVINIDGTGKRVLGIGFRPQWVGNSQIVYERTTDNGHSYLTGELYILNINGGAEKALTNSRDRIEMYPSISPDGNKIAFVSNTDGQIYVADLK